MKSNISIVVPVYNRLEITKRGLFYIRNSIKYYSSIPNTKYRINVIIIDDGSTDGTGQWIKENYLDFIVLTGNGSLWWTGAVNFGIQYSLNTFQNLKGVILQNDDVLLDKTWLFNLLQTASSYPQALIGSSTAIQSEKYLIQYGGRNLNAWFATESKLNYKVDRRQFPIGFVTPSFDLYGRGLYIPVEAFEKVGLFDMASFRHRGDMDIPLRAKKAGFKLLVSYDAVVYELPQLTYGLDVKAKITLKEAYKLLTDFRSSSNLRLIYHYSRIATNNPLQFCTFFIGNLFYNVRGISYRLIKNYAYL